MRNLALIFGLLAITGAATAQGTSHRAGLVVQYGDGSVQTACVAFAEDEISGLDLLERSEIPAVIQSSGIGAAVCKIGPDGCNYPAEGCFCKNDGPRAVYWAYQVLDGNSWSYASLGAADVRVHDGDVNGWAWGAGESSEGAQPPVLSIDAICASSPSPTAVAAVASPPAPSVATVASSPTLAAVGSPSPAPRSNYLAFAAIAAALLAGALFAARRRR